MIGAKERGSCWLVTTTKAGGGDLPITVVAGWVSSVEQWISFDVAWKAYLSRPEYNVPYFHMKEFAHSKKAYATGWLGEHRKRREFLEGLIQIIQAHAFKGIAVAVNNAAFDAFVLKTQAKRLFGGTYAYCGRHAAGKARMWAAAQKFALPVQSIFEERGKGHGELIRVLERDGHPIPIFKPKIPKTPEQALDCLTPLQAADFAAYEILKAHTLIKNDAIFWDDVRESFKELSKFPTCDWGIVTENHLEEFLESVRIAKASELGHPMNL